MTDFIIYLVLIVIILALVGFWFQLGTRAEMNLRKSAQNWPKTSGTVISAQTEKIGRSLLAFNVGSPLRSISMDRFKPVIQYTYQVGDQTYQSARYKNGQLTRSGEWMTLYPNQAEKIAGDHPRGKIVSVSYDPENPALAYLELDLSTGAQQRSRVIGYVFLAAALVLLLVGIYRIVENLGAQAAANQIPAGVPVKTGDLKAGLSRALGMACTSKNFAGQQIPYTSWDCKGSATGPAGTLFIYSRRNSPETIDSVRASIGKIEAKQQIEFFQAVASLAVPAAPAQTVQDWLQKTLPTLEKTGSKAETAISGAAFALSNPYGLGLLLEIGGIR